MWNALRGNLYRRTLTKLKFYGVLLFWVKKVFVCGTGTVIEVEIDNFIIESVVGLSNVGLSNQETIFGEKETAYIKKAMISSSQ